MIGMAVVDKDGTIRAVNGAFVAMTGYPRSELEGGMNIWDCIGPPHWRASPETALAALAGHAAHDDEPAILTTETTLSRKDDSMIPVAIELSPGVDDRIADASEGRASGDSGAEQRVLAIVTRTRIDALESQVKELERYRALVNSHPAPIFAKEFTRERQGVYTIANPASNAMIDTDTFIGSTDYEIFPPEIADSLRAHDIMVLESGRPLIVEEQAPDARTGKLIDFISVKIPLFDESGWANGVAGLTTDITEQKQLTRRLSALVDALPDTMFRVHRDGTLLDFRDSRDATLAMLPELGSPEEIVGRNLRDLTLPDDIKEWTLTAIAGALEGKLDDISGRVQDMQYDLETASGRRHIEARLVRSDSDEVVAIVRDITRETATRVALEQLNLELRLANDELRQFAYVASHDLQEPLRTVGSFAELVADRYRDQIDERGRKWLDYITTGSQRMRDLIDDLLAYSQVGQSRDITSVDTGTLVAAIIQDLQSHIDEAAAEVIVGDLPTVEASEVELRQVFQNLLSNALEFRRQEASHRVSITAERDGPNWVFAVEDNGIGIEPAYHDHVFQMFQRLHKGAGYGGTGIGLALVKKIVEGWSGTIWLRSTPGEGSVFSFTLSTVPSRHGSIGS